MKAIKESQVVLGCMRINDKSDNQVKNIFSAALDNGINFFDHADIYGRDHGSEAKFGNALDIGDDLREKIYIQTKCGIRDGYYDFSREHILKQVDDSLKALKTDYIDYLLLHRPDTLMEGEEVAEAFNTLKNSGKVHNFGVSNFNVYQVEYLQNCINEKICKNQIQLSIAHSPIIDNGISMNTPFDGGIQRDGGLLEYSRINNITLQAWSPMQYGWFEGVFLGDEKFHDLNKEVEILAEKYNVDPITICIAWITRHPAKIQAVVGTTNVKRIQASAMAMDIKLTREEWYKLYTSAGHKLP